MLQYSNFMVVTMLLQTGRQGCMQGCDDLVNNPVTRLYQTVTVPISWL